jgi:hypothetical protein
MKIRLYKANGKNHKMIWITYSKISHFWVPHFNVLIIPKILNLKKLISLIALVIKLEVVN